MADIADNEVSDETGEPLQPLWLAPSILAPKPGETVRPGFLIQGFIDVFGPSAWRVEFFRGPTMVGKLEKSGSGAYVDFQAPYNIVPQGEQFYFRLDYKTGLNWSEWKYSGDLTMNRALQPPPIIEPKAHSRHNRENLVVSGSCNSGAAVSVYDSHNNKLGDATVRGTSWEYIRTFSIGMQIIKAGQKVGSEDSGPGDIRTFNTVDAPPVPTIIYPQEGGSYYQSSVPMHGSCSRGARVEVLDANGDFIAFDNEEDLRWNIGPRLWSVGTHKVRARQIVGSVASPPTDLRTFIVRR